MTTSPLRLTPIETGWLRTDWGVLCRGRDGEARIPVPAWLVEHPRGRVLFDTGMHKDVVHDPSRMGAGAPYFQPEIPDGHDLGFLLREAGVAPEKIDFVVLSHLHFDHCGGLAEVPDARLVVQRGEWEAGKGSQLVDDGVFNPADYRLGHDVLEIDGYHDLFGDGRVVCVPTPGHSPGHQSLRVELASGPVLLTADCAYCAFMLDENVMQTVVFDEAEFLASRRLLEKLRREGCRLLFGHDPEQWKSLTLTSALRSSSAPRSAAPPPGRPSPAR